MSAIHARSGITDEPATPAGTRSPGSGRTQKHDYKGRLTFELLVAQRAVGSSKKYWGVVTAIRPINLLGFMQAWR